MALRKQRVKHRLVDNAIRAVLVRLPPFVAHHVLLIGQRRLVE